MEFTYFKGPMSDLSDLFEERQICSICGEEKMYCFALDYSITSKFLFNEKEGKIGCYDCLRKGEFEFWHDTEFGLLDEKGLTKVYSHNIKQPPDIPTEFLTELKRTPQIITYQQEIWLTHCNDFMVYMGTWKPNDFYVNSPTGDGKQLFLDMTDQEMSHLWDESLETGEVKLMEWYPTYYVFECRHCKKPRGYWDCD